MNLVVRIPGSGPAVWSGQGGATPTLDKVIENVVEEVLRERVDEGSQETTIEVVHEEIEVVVVEEGEARAFYSNKGVEAFQKHLAKKSFVEKDDSSSWCRHLRRKSSDKAGRS